jgi:hypothetical protein
MFFYLADIWHDPNAIGLMGLGIGIAAIFVAIAIGIYQVRQGRIRRKLVYQTLSYAPIVSVNSAVADQVEIDIRVKGTPVKNARLLIMNIKNAGKASIHEIDYFEPLTFEFDTKVLQASILETTPPTLINPSDLPTFLTLTPQSVHFPTFPLNTNDSIQISILLERKGTLEVRGRLDQGAIVEYKPEKLDVKDLIIFGGGIVGTFIILEAILLFTGAGAGAGGRTVVALAAILLGLVSGMVTTAIVSVRRSRRITR